MAGQRTRQTSGWLVLVGALLAGCPQQPAAPGAPEALQGPRVEDAGAPPPELSVLVRAQFPDGGTAPIAWVPGTRPVIDPPRALELSVRPGLQNYRIRVFDDGDKVVESSDEADESASDRLDYRIAFQNPLPTGRRFALVFDAQTGDSVTDRAGIRHPDQRFEFQISGEKERPPATKPAGKAKKKNKKR